MKKTKKLSLNTKRKNTSKTIRSSGLKLKPRLVMSALAHNTWLRHAPKFKTDAETKTESTNSLISTRGKKSKQTTSTPSRRRSPTSTRKKCHTSRLHRKITTPAYSHNLKPRLPKSKASWKPCKSFYNTLLIKVSPKKEKKKSWPPSKRRKKEKDIAPPTPHSKTTTTTPEQQKKRNTHQSANPNDDSQKLDTAINSFNKRMTLIEKYMEKVSRYIDNDPRTQTQSLTNPEQTQTMTII